MNSQVQGLLISLGTMQVARKVPTDRPDVLLAIRVSYVAVILLQLGLYYYISLKIKAKNDTTPLKYAEPPKPFATGPDPGTEQVTTHKDYDLQQVSKQYPGLAIGVVIMAVMHLKFGYTQPLLLQSIMPLKSLYDSPLVKIWILGKPATGDLARPFKAPGGLMSALQDANEASSSAAARGAEAQASPVAVGTPKIEEITDDDAKVESKKQK